MTPILIVLCIGLAMYAYFGVVFGTGEMKRKEFPVSAYRKVRIGGNAKLVYTNNAADSIYVEMQQNVLDVFSATVDGDTLILKWNKTVFTFGHTPKIYISTPVLEGLEMSGAVDFKGQDAIASDELNLRISGAGTIQATMDVKNLKARISGAGNMRLSGTAGSADIGMSGAGDVAASELQTQHAKIGISGAGDVKIACSDTLHVTLSGAGDVRYQGSPSITQTISGAGSVKQLH